MSHSLSSGYYRIHYNSDFSGSAQIIDERTNKEVTVPCSVILKVAAEFVRMKRMQKLEDADTSELLGLE